MTKILVLYYSMYGHIETMAEAVVEAALEVDGVDVTIKRVPAAKRVGAKLYQASPIAEPKELGNCDAVIIGTPTHFGNMAAQTRNLLDQTGSLWAAGKLIGKVGSVFTSTSIGAPPSPPSGTPSRTWGW